jgi:hypothetical protein
MRRILLVLLGFGVFAGYGSAIASARWHARHHGEYGGCESRWDRDSHRGFERSEEARPAAAAPQTIVVPQAAAAPAAAPQIFLIMPGAQAAPVAPQVITVPVPAPAPAQAPTPATR